MTSTESDHKQTVRDLVTDVFNDGELDRIEEFYAEDSVQRSRQSGTFQGEFQSIPPTGRSFQTDGTTTAESSRNGCRTT